MNPYDCYAELDISYTEPINGRRVERSVVCTKRAGHEGVHEASRGWGEPYRWSNWAQGAK